MPHTFLDDVALPRDPQTAMQAATKQYTDGKIAKTGDTMTGALIFDGTVGNTRYHIFQTSGVERWKFGAGSTAESGSNAGSNFTVNRYSDAGAFIDSPMVISRASGRVTYNGGLSLSNTTIQNLAEPANATDAATKAYTDTKLALSGGTMTGPLTVGTDAGTAANPGDIGCQYIDSKYGGHFGGFEVWNVGTPTSNMSAANRQYVDDRTPKITVGTTAPSSPAVGDLWVDTNP